MLVSNLLHLCCFSLEDVQKRYARADTYFSSVRIAGSGVPRNFLYTNCAAHGSLRKISKRAYFFVDMFAITVGGKSCVAGQDWCFTIDDLWK